MAISDDEMEELPESVTNYYFIDDGEEPISFSVLPVNWNSSETEQGPGSPIYVRGNADGGLDKIFKPVKAWKFDCSGVKPEISVLSKDNNWIKLQKPRQSYEEYIRTVLITVNFLHVVKRKPEWTWTRVRNKLSDIFCLYDNIPSTKDLAHNRALIEQAVKHDESLKTSKCLMAFLERNPQKKHKTDENVLAKGKSEFVVSDDDCSSDDLEDGSGDDEVGSGDEGGSTDEEDDEPFDSVCSLCDEGGPLLCCEGSCMRSFHATPRAGKPSKCVSLGFTEMEVQALPYFKCQNCQYMQHQCFACGQLGSSDKQTGAKVFQCIKATCGYFYHPHCVAKRLHGNHEDAAKEFAEKIGLGESFTCPLHTCCVCKQAEDKSNPQLQMAVCRRCPKAYHKKCLPRKIAFEEDEDAGIEQRAWEGLLVDRILIYCLKHKIRDDLGTPSRDHIIFAGVTKKETGSSVGVLQEDKVALKKEIASLKAPSPALSAIASKKKTVEDIDSDKKIERRVPKLQKSNLSKKITCEKKSGWTNIDGSFAVEERKCFKPSQTEKLAVVESSKTSTSAVNSFVPKLDSDSERWILNLMSEASSIITLDDIIAKHESLISSRVYKRKMDPCKSITLGKVQNSCDAVRDAIKKLDGGSNIVDVKKDCEPSVLNNLINWKGKLRVHLAPFLYGMRYTSYGRHFTKVEKLKEIAELLHWYVNDDDTIVDFCCGANDFSRLMKEKLETRGRKCNYKNYDLFRPKNDFCFETRDWMDVQPNELPTGSKLIMGLNPPFGVKASKANQFINKALQFKPKLLILIVPPETERLDKKKPPYDLVWEDKDQLSGKSFYLPGSVDINDKQLDDWNVVAPVLYLWSRQDWTAKHMEIAKKHNHPHGQKRENNPTNRLDRDLSFKNHGQSSIAKEADNASPQTHSPEGLKDRAVGGKEDLKKQSARKDHSKDKQVNATPMNSKSKRKNEKKKRRCEMMRVVGRPVESSQDYKRQRFSPDIPRHEVPHHSPFDTRDRREPHNLRHHPGSPNFEPIHHKERRFSMENPTSMYKSPSNVMIGGPVHDHDHPGATNYRIGNPHCHDTVAKYHPRGDVYPNGREIWDEDAGPIPNYHHPRGYGMNQSYSETAERFAAPTYMPEPSLFHNRVDHMSAINKYSARLDELSLMMGGGAGFAHGPPDIGPRPTGPQFYNHHPGPRHEHPGIPMGFIPGSANPYHPHSSSGGWIND
ncbi:protein ENHANCED DOWNY MILDEW 2-like isoform X1 [Chenopodium quinoa]|uniref:protein ENHANCED DOWNY MILDEW 2-like isoform X1 n=2 Tax=Chenopodium quinoa TaxID=63459 RepID=UPI000B778071|nr:protein ENHANCED DOWNY MILDEW 2-like isoform X1 [Chenopodium quinoa]